MDECDIIMWRHLLKLTKMSTTEIDFVVHITTLKCYPYTVTRYVAAIDGQVYTFPDGFLFTLQGYEGAVGSLGSINKVA